MALILRPPGAGRSLGERLTLAARGQRSWAIATRMFGTVAWIAGTLAVAIGLDSLVSLSPTIRSLMLAGISVGSFFCLRALRRAWAAQSESTTRVALELERLNPDLNDALASVVAFESRSADYDQQFLAAARNRAEQQAELLDWDCILRMRRFWQCFWMAVLAGTALTGIVTWNLPRLRTAVARLIDPWGEHAWPTRTTIELDQFSRRIAIGDEWSLAITLQGVISEQAVVEFRSDGVSFHETLPINESATGKLTLDSSRTTHSFQFRVLANDAVTPWYGIEVAPPPRLESLRIHVDVPAYIGWPSQQIPDGAATLETVATAMIRLDAKANQPIRNARLTYLGDRQLLQLAQGLAPLLALNALTVPFGQERYLSACRVVQEFTNDRPLELTENHQRLRLEFQPPASGVYALRFTDETGLTGQRLIEIRTFPDPSPTASLVKPDPARDTLDLLSTSSLRIDARADDRLFAMRSLALQCRVADGPWVTSPLIDLQGQTETLPALTGVPFTTSHPATLMQARTISFGALPHPPRPGDTLRLRVAAWDWDNVSILKIPGYSQEVAIRVHSQESLEAELQRQIAALRAPLREAADAQAAAAEKSKAGDVITAEQLQNDVRNRISDPRDGLRAKLDRIQKMRQDNAMPTTATTARLDALTRELSKVDEKLLPTVDLALAAAKANPSAVPELSNRQMAAAMALKAAFEELGRWAGLAELQSDAYALGERLRKARETLEALRAGIPPGLTSDQLTADQKAALEKAAAEIAAAEADLKKLTGKAQAVRDAKRDANFPADAERVEKALRGIAGAELKKAAECVAGNRLADAEAARANSEDRVRNFSDALAGRETPDELKKKAADRVAAIDELRKKQTDLAKKAAEGGDKTALAAEQEKLARQAEKLADRAAADRAAEAEILRRAAEKMDQAAAALMSKGDGAKAANEAAEQLQKAQDQATKPPQTQEQLAKEQQEDLQKRLKAFRDRQQAAIDESLRLTESSAKAMAWDRPLVASLVTLAERENSLANELKAWHEKAITDAPVFTRLLEEAVAKLGQATQRLRERKDDALTVTAFVAESEAAADTVARKPMLDALRAMDFILAALSEKQDAPKPADAATQPKPGEPAGAGGGKQGIPPLAQLKALRDWQTDLKKRTEDFVAEHPDPAKYNDDDRAELAAIQKSQAEIATLFEQLRESLTPKADGP